MQKKVFMRFAINSSSGTHLMWDVSVILEGDVHHSVFQTPNIQPTPGQLYQCKVGSLGLHRINYKSILLSYYFLPCNHHLHINVRNQWEWEDWWQLTFPSSKYEINVSVMSGRLSGWHNSNISATFFSHNQSQPSYSSQLIHWNNKTNKAACLEVATSEKNLSWKISIRLLYFRFILFLRRSFLMT